MKRRLLTLAVVAMTAAVGMVCGGSAIAGPIFRATLLGSNEVPANASTATGLSIVTLTGNTLNVDETFSGLIGGAASAAHIHCCALPGNNAGIAVPFVGFPAATSGTYVHAFDLTDPAVYTSTFLAANGGTAAGAEAALIAGLETVNTYANIHDATFPGGEIRGWLVTEPASLVLLASALFGLGLMRRRSRS